MMLLPAHSRILSDAHGTNIRTHARTPTHTNPPIHVSTCSGTGLTDVHAITACAVAERHCKLFRSDCIRSQPMHCGVAAAAAAERPFTQPCNFENNGTGLM